MHQRLWRLAIEKQTRILVACGLLLLLSGGSVAPFQTNGDSIGNRHHHQKESERSKQDKDRWMWQLPEQVLDSIGVNIGMVVADVGAGEGYFTVRLARRVGSEGVVYANEIDESLLQTIRDRCQSEKIDNVRTVHGHPDEPNLPDSELDVVLLVNVIHLVENKKLFMQNIRNCIKPSGILAVVQWDAAKLAAEAPRGGPRPNLDEYDREKLLELINDSGYDVKETFSFLPLQGIFVCQAKKEN
jgi:ubiquinone/menaquinone biosynthesis C-methylase UbiE